VAHCDEGYGCDRCGEYVDNVQVSELYLRYVLGAVPLDELPQEPERHIRCSPELAQFIVDDGFEPVVCDDPAFDKRRLPKPVRTRQEHVLTLAWRRLQEVRELGLAVDEYPLPPERLA
jgi:hypothetical protein